MAFKFFKISSDDVSAQEELNDFLRKENKIITKTKEFYQGIWYFTIEYIPSSYTPAKPDSVKKGKEIKDYAEILPPEQFKIYSKLRDCRSILAQERSCPVYVIFTNEQLAELARGKVQRTGTTTTRTTLTTTMAAGLPYLILRVKMNRH